MSKPLKSDSKVVWRQDGDYYKPSVSIHGEDGIGIQFRGTVIVKKAEQWQDLERQVGSYILLHTTEGERRLELDDFQRQDEQITQAERQLAILDADREAERHKRIEAEAKLATAMDLLSLVHGLNCRFCGKLIRLGHADDCEYAAFLTDSSQATAQKGQS